MDLLQAYLNNPSAESAAIVNGCGLSYSELENTRWSLVVHLSPEQYEQEFPGEWPDEIEEARRMSDWDYGDAANDVCYYDNLGGAWSGHPIVSVIHHAGVYAVVRHCDGSATCYRLEVE